MERCSCLLSLANCQAQLRIISIRTPYGNRAKNSSIRPGGNGVFVVVIFVVAVVVMAVVFAVVAVVAGVVAVVVGVVAVFVGAVAVVVAIVAMGVEGKMPI